MALEDEAHRECELQMSGNSDNPKPGFPASLPSHAQ